MKYTDEQLADLNGETSNRHAFLFPLFLIDLFSDMSVEEKGLLIESILWYVRTGDELNTLEAGTLPYSAFRQFKRQYEKDAQKYLEEVKKRREAGRKGGKTRAGKEDHDPITGEVKKDPNRHPLYGLACAKHVLSMC